MSLPVVEKLGPLNFTGRVTHQHFPAFVVFCGPDQCDLEILQHPFKLGLVARPRSSGILLTSSVDIAQTVETLLLELVEGLFQSILDDAFLGFRSD